ncbi:MAG: tRNA (adenosine(37)-N6)-dimethylallyltransferase MiaA [Clostridia bacterium]|nr:tRNA (adenosine(37)-N6)-dimethylallyltransferase MiaA [Clostridia bacterium]
MDRRAFLNPIVAVVGPTASGKTALSIALARALNAEILCCDSMQIYRGLDIGTAKPTPEEQAAVPHHLVDIADPRIPFSAADYVSAAIPVLAGLASRGKNAVLCGGTGLWLDALRRGGEENDLIPGKTALREQLEQEAETEAGRAALGARLAEVDPVSAASIHPNNIRRVIRALEVYIATGTPKSEWDRRSKARPAAYDIRPIGIRFPHRERLYARIDTRVDAMVEAGLFEETARLLSEGALPAGSTAAQAIGYKEIATAITGTRTRDEAIADLKTATRRYAKRQMTWFSADESVFWLDATDGEGNVKTTEALLAEALAHLRDTAPALFD